MKNMRILGTCLTLALLLTVSFVAYLAQVDPLESTGMRAFRVLLLRQSVDSMIPEDCPIQRLEELTGYHDIGIHVAAANRLLAIGNPEPFLRGLTSDNYQRRGVSAHWLSFFDDDRILPALRKACLDDDPYVRQWAVFSMGVHGTGQDIPLLEGLVNDEASVVASRAERALSALAARGVK